MCVHESDAAQTHWNDRVDRSARARGGAALAAGSSAQASTAYTCTGGGIPSGSYASITVPGLCSVAAHAVINVIGKVASGAVLDAQTAPSTITIGHNVTADAGSLVALGCQPPSYAGNWSHECAIDPEGHSVITVKGNVTANNALAFLLNGVTVQGNVTLSGGGSDQIPGRSRTTPSVATSPSADNGRPSSAFSSTPSGRT